MDDLAPITDALDRAADDVRHHVDRFRAQAAFARGLCSLHPRHARRWRTLLRDAAVELADTVRSAGPDAVRAAVDDAEDRLAPIAKTAKTYTLYCAGHAHIDMNWMWSWPETVATTIDTFRTVLRLMDEYPAFHFSQSQASVYRIVEEHAPELLDPIRRRVREGRWEVTASNWVEGDKNLVSGESLCRHLLATRRYLKRLLGLEPEDVPIDWAPDTFGHAATIPAHLVRGGVRRYYCCRPGRGRDWPAAFRWRAPDGSELLVYREITWYNAAIGPDLAEPLLRFARETGLRSWLNVYGVGDHGGGPTRRDVEQLLDMADWPVFPRLVLSGVRPFYDELEAVADHLPVVEGELNPEFTGCYTSQSLIKKVNRFAENQLCDAEAAATLAWAADGLAYPGREFTDAWRDTLFNHFHDILPGSGVRDTRTFAHGLFQRTAALCTSATAAALRRLAGLIDTSSAADGQPDAGPPSAIRSALGAGVGYGSGTGGLSAAEQTGGAGARPLVVFNLLAAERSGVAVATVWDNRPTTPGGGSHRAGAGSFGTAGFSVSTPGGDTLPAQVVGNGRYWGHDYAEVAFPVEPLPGFGYATCMLREGADTATRKLARPGEPLVLENDRVRAEIDTATATVRRLTDLASGLDVITPDRPAAALDYAVERPHKMTAWQLDARSGHQAPVVGSYKLTANGPHLGRAEFGLSVSQSTFTLRYELRDRDPNLYLTLDGTWFERGTPQTGVPNLSIAFPFALTDARGRYEIPFGAIDRAPTGDEVPALRWAAVAGRIGRRRAGCLLANDSKHGHSLDGGTLRLTLIRSSYDPDPLPEVGEHTIRLALSPFAGELSDAEAIRRGGVLNRPLAVVGTDVHPGRLGPTGRFLAVEPQHAELSSLKKAEDGDGIVVRVYETAGKKTAARIRVDPGLLGPLEDATEIDILERPVQPSGLTRRGNTVTVPVPAFGIATVRLRTARQGVPEKR
jgi:alpha-mannosidase